MRAEVDNWRWHGVPFFLRSGKALAAGRQVITLGFHEPPLRMFTARRKSVPHGRRNEIVIDFADPGSISTKFLAKEPGAEMTLSDASMVFKYSDSFASANALEGYERLILMAMIGDQSLFTPSDGIERLWEISEPLLDNPPPVESYAAGSSAGVGQAADRALPLAPAPGFRLACPWRIDRPGPAAGWRSGPWR